MQKRVIVSGVLHLFYNSYHSTIHDRLFTTVSLCLPGSQYGKADSCTLAVNPSSPPSTFCLDIDQV